MEDRDGQVETQQKPARATNILDKGLPWRKRDDQAHVKAISKAEI
jgi:hypothetical protein